MAPDGFGGLFLSGGHDATSLALADLWQFSGGNWTQVTNHPPAKRALHTLILDVGRAQLVIFGGVDGNGFPQGDEWVGQLDVQTGAVLGWSQVSTPALPWTFLGNASITSGCLDTVRNEIVAMDFVSGDVLNDRTASSLSMVSSSTSNCIVPILTNVGSVPPRCSPSTVTFSGDVGTVAAGAAMVLMGAVVTPSFGPILSTPIGGGSCMSFLPGTASLIGAATANGGASGGVFTIPLSIPGIPALVGVDVDLQAFGTSNATSKLIASDLNRVVIGR